MLANANTEGFIPVVFGAEEVLGGRGWYHDAAFLDRANRMLREARTFFEKPAEDNFDFSKYGVTHVLVATEWYALGTHRDLPTNHPALAALPTLRIMVEGPGFALYEVVDDGEEFPPE